MITVRYAHVTILAFRCKQIIILHMEFTSQQYNNKEIQQARRSLMLTTVILLALAGYITTLGIQPTEFISQFGIILLPILLMYAVGNYKFFIIEHPQK